MKIIEPYATLLRPQNPENGIVALRLIEWFARLSHRSEEAQTDYSWDKFLRAVVMTHGDFSVIEHGIASVLFRIDRATSHQLVRHRLFSFTQESQRFVNGEKKYPDGLEFILPEAKREKIPDTEWQWAIEDAEKSYLKLLNDGWRPQEARSVLPNAAATTVGVTGNFRNWRHFFLMRTTVETQVDMRRITIPLLAQFKERIPILFDDIEPMATQRKNLEKAR